MEICLKATETVCVAFPKHVYLPNKVFPPAEYNRNCFPMTSLYVAGVPFTSTVSALHKNEFRSEGEFVSPICL